MAEAAQVAGEVMWRSRVGLCDDAPVKEPPTAPDSPRQQAPTLDISVRPIKPTVARQWPDSGPTAPDRARHPDSQGSREDWKTGRREDRKMGRWEDGKTGKTGRRVRRVKTGEDG